MNPHRFHGFADDAVLEQKAEEGPEHDAVLEQDPDRTHRQQEAEGEGAERYEDVVYRNAQKHVNLLHLLVDAHRISFVDVVQRHVDILISENQSHERVIVVGRHQADHGCKEGDDSRYDEFAPMREQSKRKLLFPEA